MHSRPVHEHPGIGNRLLKRNFLFFLPFLMILLTAFSLQAAPLIKLSPAPVFSSLVERGSNPDAMAFNSQGDLYYFGWNHGLEKIDAGQIPDGAHQLLLGKSDYVSFFNDPEFSKVINITGFGIGFSANQKVISYIKGVYEKTGSTTDHIKIGFVSCNEDGSDLAPLVLTAGEYFTGLNRVKKDGGGYEELDVSADQAFIPGERDLLQMKLLNVDGSEVILFTLWGVPEIFQVPSSGGSVTSFYRFQDTYPREMTVMGDDLIVTHNNGNIYRINLVSREISDFVTKPRLMEFFKVDTGSICFTELDYEPVSNQVYCVAQVCWNDDIPQTMMAISPDGLSITKILDENSLTHYLAPIRTPPQGKNLKMQAVAVKPVAVSNGNPSLFLGDYWSGLDMVRMDLPIHSHTIYKNAPTGAWVDLDLGTGDSLFCFSSMGRLEGPTHSEIFIPQGENPYQVLRDGVFETYSVQVNPAFPIAARCKRGQVQLTWTHRPGIVRYDIFRSSADAPENFVKIADTVSTYSTYLDRSVTNDQTYLYTVAAVYDEQTEFSDVVASTPSLSRRPGNFNPVIYSDQPPEDTWTDTTFTYRVLAADSNNDSLVYSLSNAPSGMAIDVGGLVTWTPDASQSGSFSITIVVSDPKGGQTSKIIQLSVSEPDRTLIALEVTPGEIYFNAVGQAEQLMVTGIYNDGFRQNLADSEQGTVYRPDVGASARVDGNGLVTAQNSGFSKILVTNHGVTATADVEVELPPLEPSQVQLDAADLLESDNGGIVRVRWNPRNGTVHSIHVLGDRLTSPSTDDPLTIAREFLLGHPDLFGLADLDEFPLENEYTTSHNGVTHLVLRQEHEGIKFDDNALYLHVDQFGQVISVGGDYDPAPVYPSPLPTIDGGDAVTIITSSLSPQTPFQPVPISGPEGMQQETVFEPGPFNDNPVASLRWLSMADGIHLAWWVLFFDDQNYCVSMVDAHNGDILQVTDMAAAAIPGKVFLQSPDKAGNIPESVLLPDHWFDLSDPDSPYPSYGPNTRVVTRLFPDDLKKYKTFYSEPAFVEDFLNSWRNNDGKWIYNTSVNNWEDKFFTGGNIFYWMNHLHDYFVDLGFDYASRSMEAGNYGQGIELFQNTGVYAYVRGGWVPKYAVNNACATYDTSGSSDTRKWFPVVQYGLFYKKNPGYVATYHASSDTDLDPDFIIHEYVHNVSNALIGGTIDLQPMWDLGLQAGALSEAFSDFFACSLTNDPVFGEYETGDNVKGHRILPLGHADATYNKMSEYSDSIYKAALIFSSILWDLREKFMEEYGSEAGRTKLERLVVEAMKMMPSAPDMLDARDAVIAADSTTECGAHQKMLWQVFADRGMGKNAESKNSSDNNPTPGYDLPPDYARPAEVGPADVMGIFQINVPMDIDVKGLYFTDDSRVYISEVLTGSIEYVDFEHIDCENLIVRDYTFSSDDGHDICVEKLIDNEWVEHCTGINIGTPIIQQITPAADIQTGQEIFLEITGKNFSSVHTATIIDPQANEILPAFTIVDDNHITIPSFIFTAEGQHIVTLTSDSGAAQGSVLVEQNSTQRLDAMKAGGVSYWYIPSTSSSGRDDDMTPAPYAGRSVISIDTQMPSLNGFSRLDAQLMIPPGETHQGAAIEILHTEAGVAGGGYEGKILTENAELHYREVITIAGAQLADGTVIDSGTIPCVLNITGNTSRTSNYAGIGSSHAITIAALPDGSGINFQDPSLINPDTGFPYYSISFDPETSFGQALLQAIPPLASARIYFNASPYAGTASAPESTFLPQGEASFEVNSDVFDLPVGKRVVFHPGCTYVGAGDITRRGYVVSIAGNFQNNESGQHSCNVTYKLMCEDQSIKLIYRK